MGKLNCKACSEKQSQSEITKSEHENVDEDGEEHDDMNNIQMPIKNKPLLCNNVNNTNVNVLSSENNNINTNNCVHVDDNINLVQSTHPNQNDSSNDDDNNNNNQPHENTNTPTANNAQQIHKQRKLPKKTKTLTSNNIMNRKMPLEIIDERHCETISPHRGGYYVSPYKHNPFSNMRNTTDNVNPTTSSPNINSVGNFNNTEHKESNNTSICDSSVLAKHKKWYEYEINEIINETKLNNINNNKDEVLLHNDLYKVNVTNSRKKIKYAICASVFVVITKEGMKVFRTKGNFLFNKKPLYEIKFSVIKKCGVVGEEEDEKMEVKYEKGKKAFYVDIVNGNIEEDNNVNDDNDNDVNMKEEEQSKNETFNDEKDKRKGKKMKLIEPTKKELNNAKSEDVINKKKSNDIQGGVLPKRILFVSHHKDIVNKWVCVINYFISGQ